MIPAHFTPWQFTASALGAVALGLGTAHLANQLFAVILRQLPDSAQDWQVTESRLIAIRKNDWLFRWFEPYIKELEQLVAASPIMKWWPFRSVSLYLDRGGHQLPFHATEFISYAIFGGLLAGGGCLLLDLLGFELPYGALVVVGAPLVVAVMATQKLKKKADARLNEIRKQLPFCVDLLAITMEAGATFRESLSTVVLESAGSPVGAEMKRVDNHMAAGQTLTSSMEQLGKRLRDPDIDEIVMTVRNSDQLGTPLSEIFLNLSDQMRLKRIQALEKAAGQAQAMMTFPGFIIMFASLLIIATPFALAAWKQAPF